MEERLYTGLNLSNTLSLSLFFLSLAVFSHSYLTHNSLFATRIEPNNLWSELLKQLLRRSKYPEKSFKMRGSLLRLGLVAITLLVPGSDAAYYKIDTKGTVL